MNRDNLLVALENGCIEWQRHALEQMMERGISRETVKEVLPSNLLIWNILSRIIRQGGKSKNYCTT